MPRDVGGFLARCRAPFAQGRSRASTIGRRDREIGRADGAIASGREVPLLMRALLLQYSALAGQLALSAYRSRIADYDDSPIQECARVH